MSDLIGRTLGQYSIVDVLGHGGMATVYRAHQPSMNRDVALKVIKDSIEVDLDEFMRRFDNEAQMIASLSHPHILKVFEYGKDNNMVYLAMEMHRGGSLADVIEHAAVGLPLEQAVPLLAQIADALDYAHARGIIHRDLKPSNVLLDENGNAVLTDFGIARNLAGNQRLTQTNTSLGTPAYMAPEQWMGSSVFAPADIYALGIITYEMLTGEFPFDDSALHTLMYAHLQQPPPEITDARPDLPDELNAIIDKALSKDANNRYDFARDLVLDLQALMSNQPERIQALSEAKMQQAPTEHVIDYSRADTVMLNDGEEAAVTSSSNKMPRSAIAAIAILSVLLVGAIIWAINEMDAGDAKEEAVIVVTAGNDSGVLREFTGADLPTQLTEKIAFNRVSNDTFGVYWMDATGENVTFITNGGKPSWTGQANFIAYDHTPAQEDPEIFTINITGELEENLTNNDNIQDYHAAYSPDGERVAFHSERDGNWDIYVMDADGSNLERLTDNPANDQWPAWSPDGEWIAFSSGRAGNNDIFIMRPDGSEPTQLTTNRADDFYAAWAPTSQLIAFQSNREGNWDLYAVRLDASEPLRLTFDEGNEEWPSWALNDFILYSSDEDGDFDIFALDVRTLNRYRITNTSSNEQYPVWIQTDRAE